MPATTQQQQSALLSHSGSNSNRPLEKGIEVERLLSGYRDLDALFPEAEDE